MGLLQSCLARKNKVGIMKEEAEAYEKVRKAMITEEVTEKRGGVAFDLTFVSEDTPRNPPTRLLESKRKDNFEDWKKCQEKTQAEKQERAQQNREEARIQKEIDVAHKEMERLEKYVNLTTK
ncbi:uncharacterized protein LOC134269699 [Saccostrea cucullata]|uniref:uncharacterized protein LOC134269699 n=1 Tax=Saccostrea cuccullata TaxID=36930 RepID=UPI002ED1568B